MRQLANENPQDVVRRFNESINARDLAGLDAFMTDDHVFIDSANAATRGKPAVLAAWQEFFKLFPDYRNDFESLKTDGNLVRIIGRSKCSYSPLDGPALWTARVVGGRLAEWRVYEDLPETRRQLGF